MDNSVRDARPRTAKSIFLFSCGERLFDHLPRIDFSIF
jgi:hypothetical protein